LLRFAAGICLYVVHPRIHKWLIDGGTPNQSLKGVSLLWVLPGSRLTISTAVRACNMCTCSGNGTQEPAVQDLLFLVDLYLDYLI